MSQVLRVYFFGTKRTVWTSKTHLHPGESGGDVFGHLYPVPHPQIRACPPCIPFKPRPLCKIPAEKNRDILKNKNPGLGVGSCLAVSGGCIQLEAQEYSWNVFQMLKVPEGLR